MRWLAYGIFLALLIVFWFGAPWLIRLDERHWGGFQHRIKPPRGFVPVWRTVLVFVFLLSVISVVRN
jgi:hypothetical protein